MEHAKKKPIVVVGELNVDLIVSGEDLIPEWNREKLVDGFEMVLGSSSAITACGLAGLGEEVYFVSVVGEDAFGDFCIKKLNDCGVQTSFVKKDPNLQTGVTLSFSTSQDRALLTYLGSIPSVKLEDIPESLYKEAGHLHFGSYFLQKGMQDDWPVLFADAQKHGVHTSFDTGWDPYGDWQKQKISQLLKHTDLFIPSKEEFEKIFGSMDRVAALDPFPSGTGEVVIKCGAEGACFLSDHGLKRVPGFAVDPIDTTGAGDSFNAGLIHGLLAGMRDVELLRFANACGALATQRVGGAEGVPDLKEVKDFIKKASH